MYLDNIGEKDQRGPTFWVLRLFPVLAAVVHAEHKRVKDERHNDGHHHLERVQTKYGHTNEDKN